MRRRNASHKVLGSNPDEVLNLPNPSSRTVILGFTQPLTEINTRKIPGVKARSARKAGNLSVICEPIV
jgi:hypothetical protein